MPCFGWCVLQSDSDDSDSPDLNEALRAAKDDLRAASKESERLQTELTRAMCHHLPELEYTHKKAASLLDRVDFGMLPVHESLLVYTVEGKMLGGTHTILTAREPTANQMCVLKKYDLTDATSLRTLKKEVGILARLRHPNVVRASAVVIDVKAAEAYLELPFMLGGTLRTWVASGVTPVKRLQPDSVRRVTTELFRGLVYGEI